ncbi:MAG TPA: DNA internalization-related competence protein ComEC/Rec2, partial [Longimicrobiaceae bacterium]|nr:DNA internalization-related competence protein ComEC/Rec2 [Longimicrobiaceae bacterium]
RLPRDAAPLRAGTEMVVRGTWSRYPAPSGPARWPHDPSFAGVLEAREVAVRAPPSLAVHPFLALRGRTEAHLHHVFPRHGAMADALLLGRREGLDRELRERFAKSGLVHLLAISGTHVALIAAVLMVLGTVARLGRTQVTWATLALVGLYLALIGAPASAVRAGIMVGLGLVAVLLQRPSASLPIVAASALAILAFDPAAVLHPGFQLSYAGVLGILLLRGAMLKRVPPAWREHPASRWALESMVVSLAAFVATAPFTAYHFGQVAPVSILANLPAIPLTSLALIGVGISAVVEPVVPPLGRMFADGTGLALDLLGGVARHAAELPGGHRAVAPPQGWLWAAVAVAVLLALDAGAKLRARVRWTVATGAACAAFLGLPALAASAGGGGVEVHFIDVGQGDAVAIRTPADRWILVDAGPRDEGWDAGERRVLPFLRARGVRRLEALVLTHPHADHVGGAPAVLNALEVGRVIDPGLPAPTPWYLETLRAAEARGVPWAAAREGRTLALDGVTVEFLWPRPGPLDAVTDANKISTVMHIRSGALSALLTGDAGEEEEAAVLARHPGGLRAQLLKAGHHGSRTSTSDALLDALRPELVVVSAGKRNRYGHPAPVVLRRLEARGIPVARTDREGTISVRARADGAAWERFEP